MKLLFLPVILMFAVPSVAQTSATSSSQCVRVTATSVTLRGKPSLTGKAVDVFTKNTELEYFASRNSWTLVQAGDYAGWVESNSIEPCISGTALKPAGAAAAPVPLFTTDKPVPASQPSSEGSRTYIKGPKGGCYFISSSGRKSYVDHSFCN